MFDECCEIALDARGKVTGYARRDQARPCCAKSP
jgi:hypothetical protein